MIKSSLTLCAAIVFSCNLHAQNVNIPDANFKSVLVNNNAIDTNDDDEIQVTEAQAYTGDIICADWSISDLTGIEAFTSLTSLDCTNNLLTGIDLSGNTQLTSLTCPSNQLTNLDVSANVLLTNINCTDNLLTGLNLSTNTQLTYLSIYTNSITSIDLSQNSLITHFWCMFNPLTALDLSQNVNLTFLQANNCSLSSLNLANGNNTNLVSAVVNNNSNLTCIKVDDAAYSIANWTSNDFSKDAGASYNENCSATNSLTDTQQNTLQLYPNPVKEELNISSEAPSSIVITDINGKQLLTSESKLKHQVNVSNLQAGIYFIRTQGGSIQKFIKH